MSFCFIFAPTNFPISFFHFPFEYRASPQLEVAPTHSPPSGRRGVVSEAHGGW